MVPDRLPHPDCLAPVEINPYRVDKRQDGDDGEDARGKKRDLRGLVAKIKQGGSDCADVDGEFKLGISVLKHLNG